MSIGQEDLKIAGGSQVMVPSYLSRALVLSSTRKSPTALVNVNVISLKGPYNIWVEMSGDGKSTKKNKEMNKENTYLEETFYIQTPEWCKRYKTLNSLVVQNNIWPPNLIRWHPYVFNPIILHRDPSQFVVIPDLKQTDAPHLNNAAPLLTWLKG